MRKGAEMLQEAMTNWKSGKAQILVATDVAARGLHIRNLPYVINYDFPTNLDTYIHRVGRTGRLATDGHAYSFFTRNLAPVAQPLLALLKVGTNSRFRHCVLSYTDGPQLNARSCCCVCLTRGESALRTGMALTTCQLEYL